MKKDIENTIANEIVSLIRKERILDNDIQIRPLVTCVSIRIFEITSIKIVYGKKKKYVSINPIFKQILEDYNFIKTETIKSDPWIRVLFNSQDELKQMYSLFLKIYDEAYLMFSAESFGCCSRYEICSDEKRCIHPDQLFARSCMYRSNLLKGRIFYGKNKIFD